MSAQPKEERVDRPSTEYVRGLREAMRLMREEHDRLMREHQSTPGALFGLLPSRRHHEIIGASDVLAKIGFRLLNASDVRLPE